MGKSHAEVLSRIQDISTMAVAILLAEAYDPGHLVRQESSSLVGPE